MRRINGEAKEYVEYMCVKGKNMKSKGKQGPHSSITQGKGQRKLQMMMM